LKTSSFSFGRFGDFVAVPDALDEVNLKMCRRISSCPVGMPLLTDNPETRSFILGWEDRKPSASPRNHKPLPDVPSSNLVEWLVELAGVG